MQPPSRTCVTLTGFVLLGFISSVVAHAHDEHEDMKMDMGGMSDSRLAITTVVNGTIAGPASYFQLQEHTGLVFTHILLMTLGWVFVLPISE